MAFEALTDAEIASGKSVSNTVMNKIQDNFDNHEDRIDALETGTATVYPPIIFRVNGSYPSFGSPLSKVLKTTLNFNLTVTGVRLLIDTAGSANSTSIDILYKRGAGVYTSILDTLPVCNYQDGSDFMSADTANGSVAAVLDANEVNLQAGDILALDIMSAQTGGKSFLVRIDYVKA